jgi:hypothetical protein
MGLILLLLRGDDKGFTMAAPTIKSEGQVTGGRFSASDASWR